MAKKKQHLSLTPATTWLKAQKVDYDEVIFEYVEHRSADLAAKACGIEPHAAVKTLIMEDEKGKPLVVLMHADRNVSTKSLARQIGAKTVTPCHPEQAQRNSGYMVGGTSPFGTRKKMPVYVEKTILDLDRLYINGGHRGYFVGMTPDVLTDKLGATPVDCALEK